MTLLSWWCWRSRSLIEWALSVGVSCCVARSLGTARRQVGGRTLLSCNVSLVSRSLHFSPSLANQKSGQEKGKTSFCVLRARPRKRARAFAAKQRSSRSLLSSLPANRHQIVHQSSASSVFRFRPLAFPLLLHRTSSSDDHEHHQELLLVLLFPIVLRRKSLSSSCLCVCAQLHHISLPIQCCVVPCCRWRCLSHARRIVLLLPITQTPLYGDLDTLILLASSSLEFAQCG